MKNVQYLSAIPVIFTSLLQQNTMKNTIVNLQKQLDDYITELEKVLLQS